MNIKNVLSISFLGIGIIIAAEKYTHAVGALTEDNSSKIHLGQTAGRNILTSEEVTLERPEAIIGAQKIKMNMKELCNQHSKMKEKDPDVTKACASLGCSPEGWPKC